MTQIGLYRICEVISIIDSEAGWNAIQFMFYASVSNMDTVIAGVQWTAFDCLTAVTMFLWSTRRISSTVNPTTGIEDIISHPWEEIVDVCVNQEGFMLFQLKFEHHEDLIQFMEA